MPSFLARRTDRLTRWSIRGLLWVVGVLVALCGSGLGQARARGLPSTRLGVNVKIFDFGHFEPADLSSASRVGVGMARIGVNEGTDMDVVVQALAESHMRLYPVLGLPCPSGTACSFQTQIPPATAASEMAQYITAFAQRYGPRGTFWSSHRNLPYEPVLDFEIGNEPNIRTIWIEDVTHLHWSSTSNPLIANYADYVQVYEAARTALHKVDPAGVAVVGGLADSASFGLDTLTDEALLKALPPGGVDAVGYHPWVYDVSDVLLRPDTADLRVWMNRNGFSRVPLQVNEFGACGTPSGVHENQSCPRLHTSGEWGAAAAAYTKWALCTPWLRVRNVQPFIWGATQVSDQSMWLPLVASSGTETAYGRDFLAAAKKLSRRGCGKRARGQPPAGSTRVKVHGKTVIGRRLSGRPGRWRGKPRPKLYYQWERCDQKGANCTMIGGANSIRYRMQPGDAGSTIKLLVTAISATGGATATSAHTAPVVPAPS